MAKMTYKEAFTYLFQDISAAINAIPADNLDNEISDNGRVLLLRLCASSIGLVTTTSEEYDAIKNAKLNNDEPTGELN